jgi:hypothetical protein
MKEGHGMTADQGRNAPRSLDPSPTLDGSLAKGKCAEGGTFLELDNPVLAGRPAATRSGRCNV